MRARFVLLLLAVGLVSSACSGGTGHPADPSSSAPSSPAVPTTSAVSAVPSPSVPADVPTTGPNLLHPGEQPPVMPVLATQHTPAGAVAFAKFFIQTIDWAYATTSTTYMRHYYVNSCVTCKSIVSAIEKEARLGRHFVGDRLSVVDVSDVQEVVSGGSEISLTIGIAVSAVKVVDRRGRRIDGASAMKIRDFVSLYWVDERWTVQRMVGS